MSLAKETAALLRKEFMMEWKQRYALNGLLLYGLSMVLVSGLAFSGNIDRESWNVLYWMIMLFVAVNAVAKSFMGDSQGQMLYMYNLAGATSIILSKILYNGILMTGLALVSLFFFVLMGLKSPFTEPVHFIMAAVLGAWGFAANMTLVSAIAARARNRSTLLAVLSFPLAIPQLMLGIDSTGRALADLPLSFSLPSFLFSGLLIVTIVLVSFILFPFLWRE